MKKNLRPGYLAGFQGLVSKATRIKQRSRTRTGLGAFGKGSFVPMPNAPPGGVPMEDAINAATGQTYMQDPRCPEAEKMVSKMNPCAGAECCDGGDCDPEGTPYPEDECEDDPAYQKKPEAPPAPQQQAAPQASLVVEPTAAQQAELMLLSQEAAQAEAIVTAAPTLAPPSAYTGGSPPAYAPPRASKTPSDQQAIMELVAQHREGQPQAAPRPRPALVRAAPPQAERPAIPDLLGWLKNALFGSGNNGMEGWNDNKVVKYGVPLAAAAIVAYMLLKARK